jgi:hypothetical protein
VVVVPSTMVPFKMRVSNDISVTPGSFFPWG